MVTRPHLVETQRQILTGDLEDRGRREALNRSGQWEPPAEFYKHDLPLFPIETLPDSLQRFAQGLSRGTQTPIDLAAMLITGMCASAYHGHVSVFVRHGWTEPTNLFIATVLAPGNRKSAAFSQAVEPLEEIERELQLSMRNEIARQESEYRTLEARKVQLEKDAAKADNPVERKAKSAEAVAVAQQLAATKVPVSPELLVSDITPESLVTKLAEHERISVASPEGEIFELTARYAKNGQVNCEVLLKGHSGDAIKVIRRGRHEHVRRPALTINVAIQPNVLQTAGENKVYRGRGLLARFLYSLPVSTIGRREIAPVPLSEKDRQDYRRVIRALAGIEPTTDQNGEAAPRLLFLSFEANEILKDFERELEPKLAEDGDLGVIADWAGKLCGAAVRISAVLWLSENADRLNPWPKDISGDAMAQAIKIGRYLIEHARAAFAEMGADPQVENAKRLLRWIEHDRVKVFTRRDAHQAHRARFKTVDEIDPVLDLLESHGYIRPQTQMDQETRRGRKASQSYEVNPHIFVELIESEAIQAEGCGVL
jgi:replicative DNA helicase